MRWFALFPHTACVATSSFEGPGTTADGPFLAAVTHTRAASGAPLDEVAPDRGF